MKNQTKENATARLAARDLRLLLTASGRVGGKHPPGSALGCICCTSDGKGNVSLTVTSGETFASLQVGAVSSGKAEFLVPVESLREALKPAKPSDQVSLAQRGDKIEIATGNCRKLVAVPPVSTFPVPPQFRGKAQRLPETAVLAIGEALRCASTDKARLILNGVHLDTSGKGHHVVGTDGRHLYSANSFKLPVSEPAILSSNRFLDWKPIKEAEEWKLRLARESRGRSGAYEISAGAWRIIDKLVGGNYPAWRQVVPTKSELKCRAQFPPETAAELATSIPKLPISTTTTGNYRPVVLRSDGKSIELLWKEAQEEPYQAIPVPGAKTSDQPFVFSIDRPYIVKALAFGLREIEVKDEMSAARFADGKGRQMIVMPLRLDGSLPPKRPGTPPPKPRQARARNTTTSMPKRTHQRTTPAPSAFTTTPIDEALAELSKVRESLRDAAAGLTATATKLKTAKQAQRTADKEIRSVRSTIESLRKVRL